MAKIFHASLHGLSKAKDIALLASDIGKTEWSTIDLEASSFYLLIPQNSDLRREYDDGFSIVDAMPKNLLGFQTHRDSIAIGYSKDALFQQVKDFLGKDPDKDNWNDFCRLVDYRPFDTRFAYLAKEVTDRPRLDVTKHLFSENLAFNLVRQTRMSEWSHAIVSRNPTPAVFVEIKDGSSMFPLYLYPQTLGQQLSLDRNRQVNFSDVFLDYIAKKLGYTPTPEAIFHYIYAIFNAPTYRTRYAEFLKIDFPRVPMTRNVDRFRQLGKLGEQLVNLHLMKSPILNQTSSPFINNGGGCIVDAGHPKYESGKVVINKQKDSFMDVPEAVWNFHVGGYQVCQKWLKDRKGRTLSQDDIGHYQKIVVALGQSIELMKQIDAAIPNWPLDAEYN